MKHYIFSSRLILFISLLLGGINTSLAWAGNATVDGIRYDVYITGYDYNAVADSVYVGNNHGFSGFANTATSVTYEYVFTVLVGHDDQGKPIFITDVRYLEAPVIGYRPGAFANSPNLTGVFIPNSVKTIGDYTFTHCTNLTSINLPNSVKTIGDSAFKYCTNLKSINLPNSVKTIGIDAFSNCTNLTSINIPNSVKTIGGGAFEGCIGLTNNIIIPNSVDSIGLMAFAGCKGLTSVTILNSFIGEQMFGLCDGLTNINISDFVHTIRDAAFAFCNGLTEINIPNSVNTIGNEAFYYCQNLKTITIGNSVTHIGKYAFNYIDWETIYFNAKNCECHNNAPFYTYSWLSPSKCHIIIGDGVESISGMMFMTDVSKSIDTVTCFPIEPPTITTQCFNWPTYRNGVLMVPEESLQAYREAEGWKEFAHIEAINDPVVNPGDMNGDGILDVSDVTALIGTVLNDGDVNMAVADLNGDGIIDVSDVVKLISIVLNGQ